MAEDGLLEELPSADCMAASVRVTSAAVISGRAMETEGLARRQTRHYGMGGVSGLSGALARWPSYASCGTGLGWSGRGRGVGESLGLRLCARDTQTSIINKGPGYVVAVRRGALRTGGTHCASSFLAFRLPL